MVREVRGWYTDWPGRSPGPAGSEPDIGIRTRTEPFGHLRSGPGDAGRRLVLTVDDPAAVPGVLKAAAGYFRGDPFDVWVDERRRAALLDAALVSAGFHAPEDDTVVLALVAPHWPQDEPAGLEVQEVADEAALRSWARVRLMGFSDSEDEPAENLVEEQLAARRAEWPISRYELAFLDGEPVGILAHYTASTDQMVFLLATRVPFRRRGVAQSLLRRWGERALNEGARSLLINCDEHGRPAALYRRLGFVDEVYWHRRYRPGS
ncbi:MAG TPA: GNAT family N-acetyltransferase [Acidimicrobiales bacterium]|nr:GNAT family N-acetyltransferase [Acidimicrobiales bacterium]